MLSFIYSFFVYNGYFFQAIYLILVNCLLVLSVSLRRLQIIFLVLFFTALWPQDLSELNECRSFLVVGCCNQEERKYFGETDLINRFKL